MQANPNFIAIWTPSCGFYRLERNGQTITDDGFTVWLDRKSDCERYVRQHYGESLTHWRVDHVRHETD